MATYDKLRIPGHRIHTAPAADPGLADYVDISVKHGIEVRPPVRGTADEFELLSDLNPDDLVEIEYEPKLHHWISVSQLIDDLRGRSTTRGGESDIPELPASFGAGRTTRGGVFDHLIRFVKIKTIRSAVETGAAPAARAAVTAIIDSIESKLKDGPGLYQFTDPGILGKPVVSQLDSFGNEPVLVFIHGTASNSVGSFGELAHTQEWDHLRDIYRDRIFALEHRTLSTSPIRNAIDAAKLLPVGAKLHLVTHSRGGLVGELLCLNELQQSHIDVFARGGRPDAPLLGELAALLQDRAFDVSRFVRVACPSRGTLLASGRLDLYFSAILNLIELIPALHLNPYYFYLRAVFQRLIAMKASPEDVPGIEAQRPESPLVHLLNRPDLGSKADLAIIAGNSFGGGIFQELAAFAGGAFFLKAHDFVVNKDAMYGGLARGDRGFYFDDEGDGVCHFHYFKNKRTREQLVSWLAAGPRQRGGNFAKLEYRNRGLIFPSLRANEKTPLLILAPGLFGTELAENGERVWLDARQMAPGMIDRIGIDRANVTAVDILPHRLSRLAKELGASYQIQGFGYDWRAGIGAASEQLGEKVKQLLADHPGRTVHFLGLGSGGLVLQSFAAASPGIWSDIRARQGKAILLGSPASVSRAAGLLLAPEHKLNRMLEMVDRRPAGEIAALLSKLPGIQETKSWTGRNAQPGFYCIASAEAAEAPIGMPVWYVNTPLGNLPESPLVLDAIHQVLATGTTQSLDKKPPAATPANAQKVEEPPLLYPLEEDLADAALGAASEIAPEQIRIYASVLHGHLSHASWPVVVGHYRGDSIISAERAIDEQLGGMLSENFHLELYPGPDGTAEVFHAPDSSPPGALVIGLGEVGEMSAEKVRRAVTAAAVRHALSSRRQQKEGAGRLQLGISSLLLGTYGGNALTVRESVGAVIDGVVQANLAMRTRGLWDEVRLERVEFAEIYEDLVREAVQALTELKDRRRGDAAVLVLDDRVKRTSGARSHRPSSPYQTGWWLRVKVEERDGALQYTLLTEKARADFSLAPTQRKLVAHCVDQAVTSQRYEEDISRILFELLLPRGLKEKLRDKTNVVFVVDQSSASYPWELLAARVGGSIEPLAKDVGILRQLVSVNPPSLRSSRMRTALVIGNPKLPSPWADLPEAEAEAQAVARVLREKDYAGEPLIGKDATPRAILGRLMSDNRIVHIAGHGYLDKQDPKKSGVVIGDDLYLSAAEIAQVEPIPELVFLNCCYIGSVASPQPFAPNRLAATLAEQLISMGVKAVVAAGWAVEDSAARLFATEFYRLMLAGEKFGEAVRVARSNVYSNYPKGNTWGAYQCYGNPDFALEARQDVESPAKTLTELVERVRNIAEKAAGARGPAAEELKNKLEAIDRTSPKEWRTGEMLSDMALAYAQLGLFQMAQEAYREAFQDSGSRVPVSAIEQFANLEYRFAEKLEDPAEHKELVEDALRRLTSLIDLLGKTPERLSLLGGLHKREAMWASRHEGDWRSALEKSLEYYRSAVELGGLDPYPAMNAIALEVVLGGAGAERIVALIEQTEQVLRERIAAAGSVWDLVGLPEAHLYRLLVQDRIADVAAQDELIREYKAAIMGATAKEMDSVAAQIRFLREMMRRDRPAAVVSALDRLLEKLAES